MSEESEIQQEVTYATNETVLQNGSKMYSMEDIVDDTLRVLLENGDKRFQYPKTTGDYWQRKPAREAGKPDVVFRNTPEQHDAFLAQYKKGGTISTQTTLSPPRDLPPASLRPETNNPITDSSRGFPQYIFVAIKGLTDDDGIESIRNWRQAGWTEEEYTTIRNPKGLGVVLSKK